MKKIYKIILLLCGLFCLTSCTDQKAADPEEKVICNRAGWYFMTDEGMYFTDEQYMLHYFDFQSEMDVLVCDKAECEHKPAGNFGQVTCNAQIYADQLAVYQDKIYYLTDGGGYNMEQLRCRDLDGNNDRQVAEFLGIPISTGSSACFYKDQFLVITEVSYGKTFDAETREAANSVIRLNCIDLNTGQCDVVQESSGLTGFGYSIYKAENGQFFYYSIEKEGFFAYDPEKKVLTELEVSCQAKIGKEEEKDGVSRLYHFASGDSCYGVASKTSEGDSILKASIDTGEEEMIYSNKDVYYVNYGKFILIIDYVNSVEAGITNWDFYLYDTEEQKLVKLKHPFLKDYHMSVFDMVSENGVFFSWSVDKEDGQRYYDGDFEYRYMTIDDLLEGKDNYTSIYYRNQE